MLFNSSQIEEIMSIINLQHILFVAMNVGIELLSDFELDLLRKAGFDIDEIKQSPFDEMFRWGLLSSALKEAQSKKVTYEQFKNFLLEQKPLSPVEEYALSFAKQQANSDIRGLGNKIQKETRQIIIEASQKQREKYEKIINTELTESIKNKRSITEMVSNIGHKTNDWSRDLGRIADYTMTQAYEEGRAQQIKNQYGDEALVYKKVFQSGCKKCVQLYLTKGVGSQPRLFKLSELQANGTNIGRKVDEWLPTVGPTHPHCRCMLVSVDPNYEWDETTQDFSKPKQFERKVQRKSKVKITIGEREYNV